MSGEKVPDGPTGVARRVNDLAEKAERLGIPLQAAVELTYRCDLDCVHCYCQHLRNGRLRAELRTDEWRRVLDELAELGVLHLTLTGGEPLVRPDFWDIAYHAKRLHFSLTLFTNGVRITDAVADRLADLRPASIEMSLLGATAGTHDRLVRAAGAWRRTMRAADLLRERSLPFLFKTSLMRENLHERQELERAARARGCRDYRCGTDITPRNDGSRGPVRHRLGPRRLFDYYLGGVGGEPVPPMEPSTRGLPRRKSVCGAAATGCAVNPYGDFLPCLQLLFPFGRVQERSLRDMWERPPGEIRRLRRVTTYGHLSACRACDLIAYCRRCHGLAHLEAGGWASCDPLAREMARVTRAVVRRMRGAGAPEPRRVAGGAAASAEKGDGRS